MADEDKIASRELKKRSIDLEVLEKHILVNILEIAVAIVTNKQLIVKTKRNVRVRK